MDRARATTSVGGWGLSLALALVLTPTAGWGQTIRGRLSEPGRWLVTLEGLGGESGPTSVTRADGSFELKAPGAGRYRVLAERVGFERAHSESVELAVGDSASVGFQRVTLSPALRGPPPGGGAVCAVRPLPTTPVGRAWASARTALAIAARMLDEGDLLLDAAVYRRQFAADGRTVVREEPVDIELGVSRLAPGGEPTDLVERGFVREDEGGGYRFYAPEPRVLISDAFLGSHCFRLRPDGGPVLVGLAFEPDATRKAVPDVAGVLWLEAATGKLMLLEFTYRNFEMGIPLGGAGGRTMFAELPDGSWIMPDSRLRMPLLQVELGAGAPPERWSLGGVREERVRLQRARSGSEGWSLESAEGAVEGVVTLHAGQEPLAGARVMMPGTGHEAVTDADGRFRIDGLLGGVYPLTARHDRFTALPVGPGTFPVAVEEGTTSHVELFAPSRREAAIQLCGGVGSSNARVILSGQVVDLLSAEPLVGVPLTVRFRDRRRQGDPYHEARVTTGNGGEFLYCDLPPNTAVRLRALTPGSDGTDDIEFVSGASGVERHDLEVSLSTEQSPGGVFGVVREFGSGRALEAADIHAKDTDLTVLSNRNGFFALAGLPRGLHVLEISHIGYATREIVVRLSGTNAFKVDVDLDIEAIPLEGITVTAVPRRIFGDMVDLQRRMTLGFGEYIMQDELEARGGTLASALLGRAGIRAVTTTTRMGELNLVLRGSQDLTNDGFVSCYPSVWVDGHRWSQPRVGGVGHEPVDFTEFLSVDIEAVEVYKGAASVPAEFGGGDAACGAIIIWTRRGGVTARGEAKRGVGGSEPEDGRLD